MSKPNAVEADTPKPERYLADEQTRNTFGHPITVYYVMEPGLTIGEFRDKAEAILFLAAPNLRAALEGIARDADFDKDDGAFDLGERLITIEAEARAALAKAKGE